MGKKIKDKKAKGKAPVKKAPAKAAPKASPAPANKAVAKAATPIKPALAAKIAPAAAPVALPQGPPVRVPGRPTLGVAAPRPGTGGPKFALPPAQAAKIAPGVPGAPADLRRSKVTSREPLGADALKAKIGALATAIAQIRALKRSVGRSFWEVGTILGDIRDRRLFEAKGYGSFDAFVEREIELGKTVSLRLARVTQALVKEAAVAAGIERSMAAVAALDGEADPSIPSNTTTSTGLQRSPIPVHKL